MPRCIGGRSYRQLSIIVTLAVRNLMAPPKALQESQSSILPNCSISSLGTKCLAGGREQLSGLEGRS